MATAKQSGLLGDEPVAADTAKPLKFSVSRTALLSELAVLSGVTEKKTTIPILSYFRLEALDGELRISATDLDLALSTKCDAEVKNGGRTCLPLRRIFDIIKSCPAGEIEFSIQENVASIKAGSAKFKVTGLDTEGFPEIARFEGASIEVPALLLRDMIRGTAFAMTKEESRYTLNGCKLEIGGGKGRVVATDGHRMCLSEKEFETGEAEIDRLIPARAVREIQVLLSDVKEKEIVSIAQDESHIHMFFKNGQRVFTTRLLAGQFPDYKKVLPGDTGRTRITVKALELGAAIKRVALMADERSQAIKISFSEDRLEVQAPTTENGDASDTLAIEYAGPEITSAFNAEYLLEGLGQGLGTGDVIIKIKDEQSQTVFSRPDDAGYQYIVMPMRI